MRGGRAVPPLQLYLPKTFPCLLFNVMSGTLADFEVAVSAYCPDAHFCWPLVAASSFLLPSSFFLRLSRLFFRADLPNSLTAEVNFITSFHSLEPGLAPG